MSDAGFEELDILFIATCTQRFFNPSGPDLAICALGTEKHVPWRED